MKQTFRLDTANGRWFGSHRVLRGDQIATQSQIPEGRILNMLEVPVQRTTKMLDAPPIEMDLNGNRATGTISLPSRSESWQERISSMGWLLLRSFMTSGIPWGQSSQALKC